MRRIGDGHYQSEDGAFTVFLFDGKRWNGQHHAKRRFWGYRRGDKFNEGYATKAEAIQAAREA
jgi:hypothetical protein